MGSHPNNMLFTSESVTEGHPDKLCDQISDAVLDECLRSDPESRVSCQTYVTLGLILVGGEITTAARLDLDSLVRNLGREVGFTAGFGLDLDSCVVLRTLHAQSPDIAMGVGQGHGELGAGDQGLMFGYACRQTPELMPLPILLAHRLARRLAELRHQAVLPWLGPDGKTQVTIEYRNGEPVRATHVVLAAQHTGEVLTADGRTLTEEAKQEIITRVAMPVLGALLDENTRFTVNGTGKFLVGGPRADTGLTGRKNVVDTYGGWIPHGGGAFSGKDPTKVDRSAGYMARYAAKNVVAAGLADECLLQLAYAIGSTEPIAVMVDTFGSGRLKDEALAGVIRAVLPFSPKGMIDHLGLRRPIYRGTAAYGHFGRAELPWERLDAVEALRARAARTPG